MDPAPALGCSLKDVKWSSVAVPLDLLVSTYRLPQIARLDSGECGRGAGPGGGPGGEDLAERSRSRSRSRGETGKAGALAGPRSLPAPARIAPPGKPWRGLSGNFLTKDACLGGKGRLCLGVLSPPPRPRQEQQI